MRPFLALVLLLPQSPPVGAPIRLPAVADTVLSTSPGEERINGGDRTNIRLKGIEDLSIIDFDVAPIRGKTVEEARLFIVPTGANKLHRLGISSISSPWKEGTGNGTPAKPGEACFAEAARGERPWAHPGSDFHAVSFGRGGSIWFSRELRAEADGWLSADLPAAILHAMVEKNSFGLALSDEHAETMSNNSIFTREQNSKAPFILVTRVKDGVPPPSGARAWTAPAARPPSDRSAEVLRKLDAPASVPPLALPDGTKVRVLYESETRLDAPAAGRIWDGRAVTLHAARGEFIGFELLVETAQAKAVSLAGAGWTASRVLAVGKILDPLVPVGGDVEGKGLFHVKRYVPKTAPVGELKAPLTLKVGEAEVPLPVSVRVHSATLPDELSFQVSLNAYGSPGQETGEKDGSPAFLDLERAFHRMAHEHRATIAIVPTPTAASCSGTPRRRSSATAARSR